MFEVVSSYFNMPWVYYTFICIYFATTVTIIGVSLSENRNPVKSLAWVTVLFLLPIVGIILYLFFGRSIKNKRMISRRNRRKLRKYEKAPKVDKHRLQLEDESHQLINLAGTLAAAPYYPDNTVEIFTDGHANCARPVTRSTYSIIYSKTTTSDARYATYSSSATTPVSKSE